MSSAVQFVSKLADLTDPVQLPVYFMLAFIAVLSVATSSIAIDCANSTNYSKGANKQYASLILTVSLVVMVGAGAATGLSLLRSRGIV